MLIVNISIKILIMAGKIIEYFLAEKVKVKNTKARFG